LHYLQCNRIRQINYEWFSCHIYLGGEHTIKIAVILRLNCLCSSNSYLFWWLPSQL
jgi:hypothetical protein